MGRVVALRRWSVAAGLLFAAWQALPWTLPEPGVVLGAQRACTGAQLGFSTRLTLMPMPALVVDELLPATTALGPRAQCRLRLVHEALAIADLLAAFAADQPTDRSIGDIRPHMECAIVEMSAGRPPSGGTELRAIPRALISGCGVDEPLELSLGTLWWHGDLLADAVAISTISGHGFTPVPLVSARRVTLYPEAITAFVTAPDDG